MPAELARAQTRARQVRRSQAEAYSDLFAEDARGRALPSRLTVAGRAIGLRIDIENATFPIVVDPLVWGSRYDLTPNDSAAYDGFGTSLATSGDTLLVGATKAAYVFVRDGAGWAQQQKFTFSDDLEDWPNQEDCSSRCFRCKVALSGDTALVARSYRNAKGTSSGSAYVFVRSGSTWSLSQELTAEDGKAGDHFGYAAALAGDTAILTALTSPGSDGGSAYVFERAGSTFEQKAKLTADVGGFGKALALHELLCQDEGLRYRRRLRVYRTGNANPVQRLEMGPLLERPRPGRELPCGRQRPVQGSQRLRTGLLQRFQQSHLHALLRQRRRLRLPNLRGCARAVPTHHQPVVFGRRGVRVGLLRGRDLLRLGLRGKLHVLSTRVHGRDRRHLRLGPRW